MREWKVTSFHSGRRWCSTTWAAASVACPQRSTSIDGVNQRSAKLSPWSMMNAVSARLFSRPIACITSSLSHSSRGQTAAGLPKNTRSVNASTW